MTSLTRDGRLFEVAGEDLRRNYGLGATVIAELALRDVVTEDVRFVFGESVASYRPLALSRSR